MPVVAVVSLTTREEEVVLEAAGRAEELDTELHVVYVLGLSWLGDLEVRLFGLLGFSAGVDRIRDICERTADRIASTITDDYTAVGLVGRPAEEVSQYVREVGAEYVVVDREADWTIDVLSSFRDPRHSFDEGVTVVSV